jgi:hypothetical protein
MSERETPGQHPVCIGGNRCVCYHGTEHEHCICKHPSCACHSAAGYALAKIVLRNGEEVYAKGTAGTVGLQVLEVTL